MEINRTYLFESERKLAQTEKVWEWIENFIGAVSWAVLLFWMGYLVWQLFIR